MSTLYELKGEYLQLLEMLEDPDIEEQVVLDTLEGIDYELEIKAENYAKIMKELEGNVETIKTEQQRLADKKSKLEANIKRLKDNLQEAMIATGKTKFKTDLFSFNIQKNGGAAPVLLDVDTSELPDELVIYTEKPNLKAIGELLKSDPECKYAHFGERGESLRIK
jgi:chromosome segregation ATPase